jgi:hypothetical protein
MPRFNNVVSFAVAFLSFIDAPNSGNLIPGSKILRMLQFAVQNYPGVGKLSVIYRGIFGR